MNRRRALAIAAAVLLTLFGTVVLIGYVRSAERRAQEGAELVTILVATEEIPTGTLASELAGSNRVAAREVPRSVRAEDAVLDLAQLDSQVTVQPILDKEPIVARQFGEDVATADTGVGSLEEGREVISVALEPQRALGVEAGDFVGVLVSIEDTEGSTGQSCGGETAMILTSVRVVAVAGVNPETGEAGNAITVSFDVDQSQAEAIAFAAEYGRIWLTRQRDDAPGPNDRIQTCDDILPGQQVQDS